MKLQLLQRTELALRALLLLETGDTMRAPEMAPKLDTTPQYLPQVLRPLVAAGWLGSEPGPTGGYRLVEPLASRSMLELIELLEGPTESQVCVLNGGRCGDRTRCALHIPWAEARQALVERLAEISLSEESIGGRL